MRQPTVDSHFSEILVEGDEDACLDPGTLEYLRVARVGSPLRRPVDVVSAG